VQRVLKQASILLATATVAVVMTGCSESKISQCNKIIEVANKAVTTSQEFGNNPQPEKGGKALTEMADKLDGFTASMTALELSDEKLKGFRDKFVSMYKLTSEGLRKGAVAIDKKDADALTKEMEVIQKGTSEEGTLVNDINGYCTGK
jgi:hypothetical protein